ncbi:MAG: efflux RND transporter periplasmic adaptor subunit [Pseudomonadota bacterium]|nr:efflux RND transporter periplasmic adaptor subunit [Pseudomonadota bacterium]
MNQHFSLPAYGALLLTGLLAGCGGAPAGNNVADSNPTVAVTTMTPVQQTFHNTVLAWGSAMGDPDQARAISLAHGGQIIGVPVSKGQTVKRGQALLVMAPDPASRMAFQQAQSALSLANGDLQRTQQLAAQRLATHSQLAGARKAVADAKTTLAAQRAMGGGASGREVVKAPADGVVTALNVALGQRVSANAPLLNFTPAHALIAQLGIQPQDVASLHPGMQVQVQRVYDPSKTLVGTLRVVGQAVEPSTSLYPAKIELPASASAELVIGASLSAQIRTNGYTAWAVPRDAVLNDQQGDYLFQVKQGHAKRIDVKLLSPDGKIVGVRGPLDPQAKVIVLGVYELADGAAVSQLSAQPAPSGTAATSPSVPANTQSAAKPGQAQ